jgi:beta-lactamase regulating signal transducer with metallopeptidase domain
MLELAVRSTVILGVAWAAALLLRRASAATRHLVWHAAVVAVLAAPLLAPLTPSVPVPVLHEIVTVPRRVVASVAGAPITSSSATPDVQASQAAKPLSPTTESPLAAATRVASSVWAIGSAALLVWFAAGWAISGAAVRRAARAPLPWLSELNDLQERLHVGSEVGLRVVDRVSSPVAVGLLRSTILLPSSAVEWSADRRRSVLLHELAHVRRSDCRVQAVAQAACALYWFNPLAWIAMAALRVERERACDDEVIRHGTLPSDYAAHLLDIARDLQPTFAPHAALAMARPSELEGRLLAVLATGRARVPDPASSWLVALLIASTTVVALSARPVMDPVPPPLPQQPSRALRQSMLGAVPTFAEQAALSRAQAEAATVIESSSDPQARERAVLDLAAAATDTTIPSLLSALDDESEDVREKAALALGLLSTPEVIPSLLKALLDRSPQVREKAAMGLALRRDARSVDALIAAIDDSDAQVREKVVMALGTSNDRRAHAALVRALEDPDGQVREKAVMGLSLLSSGQPDESTSETARGGLRDLVRTLISLTR